MPPQRARTVDDRSSPAWIDALPGPLRHRERLGRFAPGHEQLGHVEAGLVQTLAHARTIAFEHRPVGHEQGFAAHTQALELAAHRGEGIRSHLDPVRAGTEIDGDGLEREVIAPILTSTGSRLLSPVPLPPVPLPTARARCARCLPV